MRRNASERSKLTVATQGDFIKMRIEQLRQFSKVRGTFKTTKLQQARAPYGNGILRHQVIPRTTNGDVKALAQAWNRAFVTYGVLEQPLGGEHNEAFETTHRRRWAQTRKLVERLTARKSDDAEFARNAEFWQVWLSDVAKYLSVRQQGQPSRLNVIIDVIGESVGELPETLGNAAEHLTGALDAATEPIKKAVGPWLKWGVIAGAGLLIVPPVIRALRTHN